MSRERSGSRLRNDAGRAPGGEYAAGDVPFLTSLSGDLRALRVVLRRPRVELVTDHRFVADDPRVVPRLDHVRAAGADVLLRPVLVGDVQRARQEHADVVRLAAVRADDRLDAIRPAPAGLQGHAG